MEDVGGDVHGVLEGRVGLLQPDARPAQLHHGGRPHPSLQSEPGDGPEQHAGGSEERSNQSDTGGAGGQDIQWQTDVFRSSIIRKLEEAVRNLSSPPEISAKDLERQVFRRTNSKEDYLSFVARLILYVRQQADGQGGAGPDAENFVSSQEDGDPGGGKYGQESEIDDDDDDEEEYDEDWSDSGPYNFVDWSDGISVSEESDIETDLFYKVIDEDQINKFEDEFFAALSSQNKPKRKNEHEEEENERNGKKHRKK